MGPKVFEIDVRDQQLRREWIDQELAMKVCNVVNEFIDKRTGEDDTSMIRAKSFATMIYCIASAIDDYEANLQNKVMGAVIHFLMDLILNGWDLENSTRKSPERKLDA